MEVRAIAVRIADKLEQFNGQTYFLMDSSAVEYIDKNGNSQSLKDVLDYGIDGLSKEDVERLLGLTKEEIEAMADLILDTEVRIDKTYSSSKIYTDIQQCLEDSKTYTLEELGKKIGASYEVVTSTDDMVSQDRLYLLNNGNNYDIYIVDVDNVPVVIGDTSIDLSGYVTKTEIESELGTERLGTTSQTVKGAINELFQSVTNEGDITDLENRITTNENSIIDLQEQIDNLDIPEDVDLTEINTKITQLENTAIKKTSIYGSTDTTAFYVKIGTGTSTTFGKILIMDIYGGSLLITGAKLSGDYKSFKVVRLANGSWNNYSPSFSTENKLTNVYYGDGFIYVKSGNFTSLSIETRYSVEKITELPDNVTELPILDLTQGATIDLTEINTKLTALENKSNLIPVIADNPSDLDLNNYKENGDYSIGLTENYVNIPTRESGLLTVIRSVAYRLQIYTGVITYKTYIRVSTDAGKTWKPWMLVNDSTDTTDINDRLTQLENTISGGITNNDVYTTKEQAVGTWVNGKTLYRTTFENYSISGSAGNSYTTLSRDFSERCIVRVEGVAKLLLNNNNPVLFPLPLVYERLDSDGGGYDYVTVRMGSNNYQLNLVWSTKTSKVTGYSVSVYFYKENE